MNIPETVIVPIDKLKVDNQNPNRMTKKQHEALAESISKYGFINPIITNKEYLIADGEQRWTVAKSLGMTEVSVIRLPVSDVDRRLLRQVLNKLKGEHLQDLDAQEFLRIVEAGERETLKKLINISDAGVEKYLDSLREIQEDTVPEVTQTNIKRGDIYQLGNHRLMCGDATDKNDVTVLMNGKKVDMVFTDPPYGLGGYAGRSGKFEAIVGDDNWIGKIRSFFLAIPKVKNVYVCCDWRVYPLVVQTLGRPSSLIVWAKNNFGMGRGYRHQHEFIVFYGKLNNISETDLWKIDKEPEYIHPTQKPIELCSRAIYNSSLEKETILDLYGGSGSTLITCEQTDRICFMMEIDPQYCQVIIDRWETLTKRKALKHN